MLRVRRTAAMQCAARPLPSVRATAPLLKQIVPAARFRTAPTVVFAKAEKKDAGGAKGGAKGADKKDGAKIAKTGQKGGGEEGRLSTEGGAKKIQKSKEQIAAERKERKTKAVATIKKLARKRRNFWDIAMRYKDYGVGLMFRRSIWPPENQTFWTITRVRMRTVDPPRGKVWGIFTWRGKVQKKERQIHGPLKREWTLYEPDPNAPKLVEQKPSAAHYEEPRALMNAVYGVARTKTIVPRSRYGPLNIDTSWHNLTEEERKPVPGLPLKSHHGWDVPPPPLPQIPPPGMSPETVEALMKKAVEAQSVLAMLPRKPTEK